MATKSGSFIRQGLLLPRAVYALSTSIERDKKNAKTKGKSFTCTAYTEHDLCHGLAQLGEL